MIIIEKKPDIIAKKTSIIELGKLEDRLVTITDDLIEKNKKTNNSLQSGYWITLDNDLYYFKVPPFTQGYINELLGEKISIELGLETIHNQLASGIINQNGKEIKVYGLLSKWARKPDYSYHILKKALSDVVDNEKQKTFDSSDLSILKYIDQIYPNQPICKQLRAFIIRDFFTQETDRIDSELLVATKDNKTELGFLSDYEYEWMDKARTYSMPGLFKMDLQNQETILQIQQDQFFQESLIKVMDINIITLLEKVKEDYRIRLIDYDKNNYKEKAYNMKRLIRKGLIK